jgi:hypothetical protein
MAVYDINSTGARDGHIDQAGFIDTAGTTISIGQKVITSSRQGLHGFLGFNTSTIPASEVITSAILTVKVAGKGTGSNVPKVRVYGANFGASLDASDYNQAQEVDRVADILQGTETTGTTKSINIPSRLVKQGAGAFTDFELFPIHSGGTITDQDYIDIYSGDAAGGSDKPLLSVVTVSVSTYRTTEIPQGVGVEAYLAANIESTPGTPVKGKMLFDVRSIALQGRAENLASEALRSNRVRPFKMAVGRSGAEGNAVFEITPEKWTVILPAIMKKVSTTSLGDPDGDGRTEYKHVFKVGQSHEIKTLTLVQKYGAYRRVYPGGVVSRLEIPLNLDQLVTGTMDLMARDCWEYDQNAAGGAGDPYLLVNGATYDAYSPLSFVQGSVESFDGLKNEQMEYVTVRFINNFNEKRAIRRDRAVVGHFPLGFSVEVEFNLWFSDNVALRRFLGDSGYGHPFRPGMSLTSQDFTLSIAGEEGVQGQEIKIRIPKLRFTTVDTPVDGEGGLMQRFTGQAIYDATEASNVVVEIINEEPATWFDPSTDEILVRPR